MSPFNRFIRKMFSLRHVNYVKHSHLFDPSWYRMTYKNTAHFTWIGATLHYILLGAEKGLDPSPNFSTKTYLHYYPDVAHIAMNPLIHYERFGRAEGRKTWDSFCPSLRAHALRGRGNPESSLGSARHNIITFISGEPSVPGHVYRVERYVTAVEELGFIANVYRAEEVSEYLADITRSKIIIIWRAGWTEQLAQVFYVAHQQGIKIVFDIDDLMINPLLAKKNIIDGIRTSGLQEKQVASIFKYLQTTMLQADYCSAPTQFLATQMQTFFKPTFVLPNGFDHQTWQTSRMAVRKRNNSSPHDDAIIRIGYPSGTLTHQQDFALITHSLVKILRKYKQCRLVIFYNHMNGKPCLNAKEFPDLFALSDQIEWRNYVPLAELPIEIARFDICLAPVVIANPFCQSKSELKFFESALVEVPLIASPTQPFCDAIIDGVTGFLAENEESWYHILAQLIENPELRHRIGRQAYLSVLWKYGPERRTELMILLLEQVIYPGRRAARAFEFELLRGTFACVAPPELTAHTILFANDTLKQSEITVILSLYNDASHIMQVLQSLEEQTVTDLDLIIVDDGSIDQSVAVALAWINNLQEPSLRAHVSGRGNPESGFGSSPQARDNGTCARFNRILLIKNAEHSGLTSTNNVGISHAETLFVLPCVAHTVFDHDFVESCIKAKSSRESKCKSLAEWSFASNPQPLPP